MVYIYGLKCPVAGVIRYVGKSINPQKRLIAHLTGARTGAYKHHTSAWLRKILAEGLLPELVLLEEVSPEQDWRAVERGWIQKALSEGWPLTNSTAGGEGLDFLNQEEKTRYIANLRAAMRRWAASPQGKAGIKKMLDSHTPQTLEKRRLATQKAWLDPEKSARMHAFLEIGRTDPEAARKRGEATKKRWAQDPKKMLAGIWTNESRAKHKAAKAKSWADPESRKRLMNRWTPEARAKQAKELASRQAKIQAARTPEVRAKQAAALKATWAKRKAAKLAEAGR